MWVTHILVATRSPWASVHHTQLLEMANEIQNTFYRTHAFYLFLFIPCSFVSFFLSFSVCLDLPHSFLFIILAPFFFFLNLLMTHRYRRCQMKKRSPFIGLLLYFLFLLVALFASLLLSCLSSSVPPTVCVPAQEL